MATEPTSPPGLDRAYPASTLAGLCGSLAGGVLAIMFLPDPLDGPGDVVVPALCLALGLLASPLALSARSLLTWLRAEHILMVGLVYWLLTEPLLGFIDTWNLSRDAVESVLMLITLFVTCFWLGTFVTGPRLRADGGLLSRDELSRGFVFSGVILCFFLGMVAYVVPCRFSPECLLVALGSERFAAAWSTGALGGAQSFIGHFSYFGYLVLPLTVALYCLERRASWRIWVGALLALVFVAFLIRDGGRRIVGMVGGAGILVWLLMQRQFAFRQMAWLGAWVLLLLALLQAMIVYRRSEGGVFEAFSGDEQTTAIFESGGLRVDQNFASLGRLTAIVPEQKPYVGMKPIVYTLVRPIPRYFWPDKPDDKGIRLAQELQLRVSFNHTVTTSVIGDWYLVAGAPTVALGGALTGMLARLASSLLLAAYTLRRRLMYALAVMSLFVSLRAMHEIVVMSYPLLAFVLIVGIRRMLRRGAPAAASPAVAPAAGRPRLR